MGGFSLANPDFVRRKFSYFDNEHEKFITNYVVPQLQLLVNMRRINGNLRNRLLADCGGYINRKAEVDWSDLKFHEKAQCLCNFWKDSGTNFKNCFDLAKVAYLHQPSSCSSEPLFSILKLVLQEDKESLLDDYAKASVYSRYEAMADADRVADEPLVL